MRIFIIRCFILLGLFFPTLAAAVTPMVAAGNSHTALLQSDGTVMTWGNNDYGQLGDGTALANRMTPTVVPNLTGVVAIATGGWHTIALKADGTVLAWGSNFQGQLGDGTITKRNSPVVVPGLTGVVAVAAGSRHTVALKSDGTVVAWGYNFNGQLGVGTLTNNLSPAVVPGLNGVVAAACGNAHTVVLKSDGTVLAWGTNFYGELGDGTNTQRLSPVVVPGLTGVAGVSAGLTHSVAVKADGTVAAWGWNSFGQLGDGTNTQRMSPVVLPGLIGVVAVASGLYHNIALKSDGTVMTWGWNIYGQLGNSTTATHLSPVPVPGLNSVMAVAAGSNHTVVLKSDGTVMTWGLNYYGQLGDSTTITRLSPVGVLGFLPPLTYSAEAGYGSVGASPATGFLSTLVNYKVVYSHAANIGPSAISVCIDALPCSAMSVDSSAIVALRDGNYTNGEQYVFTTTLDAGTHSYYFTASDGTINTRLPATGSLSGPAISSLTLTSSILPSTTIGVAYSQTLGATGGTPPYSWSSGGIPPGLSLNTSTGEISGTPTQSGTFGFSVALQDATGISLNTALSIVVAVNPAATVPDAPMIGIAIAANARAIVSFTPPANNGGDAIKSYTVSCSPTCNPVTGIASPITVLGLTNGTTYSFRVSATNNIGTGSASSASNSVTPTALPAPTGLTVYSISTSKNHLTWTAPAAANVTHYKIYRTTPTACPPGMLCAAVMPYPVLIATISGSPPATSYIDTVQLPPYIGIQPPYIGIQPPYIGINTPSYNVQACNAYDCSAFSATAHPSSGGSYPDLIMSTVSKTATTVGAGHSFTISNAVRNLGAGAAASSTVKFYLSLDTTITTADIPLTGARVIPALTGVTTSSLALTTVTVPYSVAPRIYYVGACADVPNMVIESNEANNCKLAGGGLTTPTINVIRNVNLRMTEVNIATVAGKTLTIFNTERNVGMTHMTAASNTVKFYLSTDATINTADIAIGSRVVPRLLAGQGNTATTTVTIPDTVASGVYYVGACADVPSVQIENIEVDNCKSALGTINVVGGV